MALKPTSIPADELLRSVEGLPLTLTAAKPADVPALLEDVAAQRSTLRQALAAHGALLFRGCGITDVAHFEGLMAALGIPSTNPQHYFGEVVRAGTGPSTLEPTQMPADTVIAPHNEYAFWYEQPLFLSFFCEDTAASFGQTPLIDCAAVAAALSPTIRKKLIETTVINEYVFDSLASNAELVRGQKRNSWQRAFGVSSVEEVEACLQHRADVTLRWRKRDRLHIQVRSGTFARHPLSDALCLRALRAFDFPNARYMLRELAKDQLPYAKGLASQGMAGLGEWLVSRGWVEHQRYAWKSSLHGPKLTKAEVTEITETLFQHATIFRWHPGDVLIIDNIKTAHGRLNVDGRRILHVYMSENVDKNSFMVPSP